MQGAKHICRHIDKHRVLAHMLRSAFDPRRNARKHSDPRPVSQTPIHGFTAGKVSLDLRSVHKTPPCLACVLDARRAGWECNLSTISGAHNNCGLHKADST